MKGPTSSAIAIIGMAARLPQDADSVPGFWKLLCEGRSARSRVPRDRFNVDAFYDPDPEKLDTVRTTPTDMELNQSEETNRSTHNMAIGSLRTWGSLMPHSSGFQPLRQLLWILSSVVLWRLLIMHSKTV